MSSTCDDLHAIAPHQVCGECDPTTMDCSSRDSDPMRRLAGVWVVLVWRSRTNPSRQEGRKWAKISKMAENSIKSITTTTTTPTTTTTGCEQPATPPPYHFKKVFVNRRCGKEVDFLLLFVVIALTATVVVVVFVSCGCHSGVNDNK
jgi:hypothetical protein